MRKGRDNTYYNYEGICLYVVNKRTSNISRFFYYHVERTKT
jgi:hypothetical protein